MPMRKSQTRLERGPEPYCAASNDRPVSGRAKLLQRTKRNWVTTAKDAHKKLQRLMVSQYDDVATIGVSTSIWMRSGVSISTVSLSISRLLMTGFGDGASDQTHRLARYRSVSMNRRCTLPLERVTRHQLKACCQTPPIQPQGPNPYYTRAPGFTHVEVAVRAAPVG